MSVYVDDAKLPFGRYLMCHLWADSRDELLAMVDKIGVQRKWIQEPPKASWLHFDIVQTKRAAAIRFGAIVTDKYGPSEHVARLRGDAGMIERIAQVRAERGQSALL